MDEQSDPDRVVQQLNDNARALERELEWFADVLDARLRAYFHPDRSPPTPPDPPAPALEACPSSYAAFSRAQRLDPAQRLILVLALVPHVRPQLLDVLWTRNEDTGRGFTEFGGLQGGTHGGFVPTGETALFLLAGDDLAARFAALRHFEPGAPLMRSGVLRLGATAAGESALSGVLSIAAHHLQVLTTGVVRAAPLQPDFPARRMRTGLDWEDLVLPQATLAQLEEIKHWMRHGETLLREWGMDARLQPGFTCLFHGAPGTGKTLSACLLGKLCGRDVYRIDLALVVSKYIGETEKNLARIFDRAEHEDWILFFDEADALFGKRTRVDDAHDRYANQEISFLLQRIEEFDGVVILASNLKSNIDDAFLRRFQSVVYFPLPRPAERMRLWSEAFSQRAELDGGVVLREIAERHELAGGSIMNVVRHASLMALSRRECVIRRHDIEEGIRRERLKEGRAA